MAKRNRNYQLARFSALSVDHVHFPGEEVGCTEIDAIGFQARSLTFRKPTENVYSQFREASKQNVFLRFNM